MPNPARLRKPRLAALAAVCVAAAVLSADARAIDIGAPAPPFALPPGGARSDAARVLKEAADRLNEEQLLEARVRERAWKDKSRAK